MGSIVHLQRVRYAVVEARYDRVRSERFVIAYQKDKTLRAFIAARRIIATGFSSENEAAEMLDPFSTRQGRWRRWLRPIEAGLSTVTGLLAGLSPAK
jgi:hypothetical protein